MLFIHVIKLSLTRLTMSCSGIGKPWSSAPFYPDKIRRREMKVQGKKRGGKLEKLKGTIGIEKVICDKSDKKEKNRAVLILALSTSSPGYCSQENINSSISQSEYWVRTRKTAFQLSFSNDRFSAIHLEEWLVTIKLAETAKMTSLIREDCVYIYC